MNKVLLALTLCALTSCCPHHLAKFEAWSKECQEYRAKNSDKLLIPYIDDVIEGRD